MLTTLDDIMEKFIQSSRIKKFHMSSALCIKKDNLKCQITHISEYVYRN
jgi:hypothetical protein